MNENLLQLVLRLRHRFARRRLVERLARKFCSRKRAAAIARHVP